MIQIPLQALAILYVVESNISMGDEKPHVAAIQLWGYTSGTANLTDDDFEHLLFCIECQSLVNQFIDVLDHIPPVNPSHAA